VHVGLVVYGGLEETSGGFRYDRRLVSHLERRGEDVEVIALPWRSYGRHLLDGVSRTLRRRLDRPFDVLLQDELCHPSLWRHNRRLERPETIVSLVHLLRSGRSEGRSAPRRAVETAVERRYLEGVDAAICTSRDTRNRTVSLADRPTLVAPPAGRVEEPALDAETVATRARADGPLRVAFVGNVIPRKGATTLIEGLSRVEGPSRCDRAWELTVVGSLESDPEYAASVADVATERGVRDRVTFTGELPDTDLEAVLERSHVLAVPSSYEGFGMVYLEAMEHGVVPIASSVGGASEIVDDGRNGFLVGPDAPGTVANLLERLATDRDELAALGTAALETAAAHPTWEETMDSVRSFLLERVDGKPADGERTERRTGTGSRAGHGGGGGATRGDPR
jgi:glycosyltransferase involved in cell wall biosynthesis